MKLSEVQKNYVFSTRLEFGEDFVELRELNQEELLRLRKAAKADNEESITDKLGDLFESCLVAHSITREDGKTASNKEVYEALSQSSTLFSELLNEWANSLPFHSRVKRAGK